MNGAFFRRAIIPHAVLCALALVIFLGIHDGCRGVARPDAGGQTLLFAVVLVVLSIISCCVTTSLLNGGEMLEGEGAGSVLLGVLAFNFLFALGMTSAAVTSPVGAFLGYAVVKSFTLAIYLALGNAGASFARWYPELEARWEQERKRQEEAMEKEQEQAKKVHQQQQVRAARGLVEAFYRKHEKDLKEFIGSEIFRAAVLADIPDMATPEAAHLGARNLIDKLQMDLGKAREVKRLEAEKRKKDAEAALPKADEALSLLDQLTQAEETGDKEVSAEVQSKLAKLSGNQKKKRIVP